MQKHLHYHMQDQFRDLTQVIIYLKYIQWKTSQKKKRTSVYHNDRIFKRSNSARHKDSTLLLFSRVTSTWTIKMRMSQSMLLVASALFQTVTKESMEDPQALQTFQTHAI